MDAIFIETFKRGLHGKWAHPDPFTVFDDLDWMAAGKQVEEKPYTIWQMLCHMHSWGWIVIKMLQGSEDVAMTDADNFFPAEMGSESEDKWIAKVLEWKNLADKAEELLENFEPEKTISDWDNITHADSLMILISHNSYHSAQVVGLRKTLGIWNEEIGSGELEEEGNESRGG